MQSRDELRALMRDDTEFEGHAVKSVDLADDGTSFTITVEDGWSLWVECSPGLRIPETGNVVRLYGSGGLGSHVRGVVLVAPSLGEVSWIETGEEIIYRYQTKSQMEAEHAAWVADKDRADRDKWSSERAVTDGRVAILPTQLRLRMERFLAEGGDEWGAQFGFYELFCCEEAAKIAAAHGDGGEVATFRDLTWEQQKARVPTIDDGHSGNTFGASVRLAYWLHTNAENVVREHAAMCPLVGCREAKCWAATNADQGNP